MSILIKGMEMPGSCWDCELTDSEYCTCVLKGFYKAEYYVGCYGKERAPWCPLVPVPPHGRLIDADALEKRIKAEGVNQAEQLATRFDPVVRAYGDCYGMVQNAPTIIEAEG